MNSDSMNFEMLFRRVSSSETNERFKTFRYATTEDLARTFDLSLDESAKRERLANCPPAPNDN